MAISQLARFLPPKPYLGYTLRFLSNPPPGDASHPQADGGNRSGGMSRWRAVHSQDQTAKTLSQAIDKAADGINGLTAFGDHTGGEMPFVLHALPNLEGNRHPGCASAFGQARSIG